MSLWISFDAPGSSLLNPPVPVSRRIDGLFLLTTAARSFFTFSLILSMINWNVHLELMIQIHDKYMKWFCMTWYWFDRANNQNISHAFHHNFPNPIFMIHNFFSLCCILLGWRVMLILRIYFTLCIVHGASMNVDFFFNLFCTMCIVWYVL